MSRKVKLIVAGGLLTFTAMALGLILSVVFSVSTVNTRTTSPSNSNTAQQSAPSDQALQQTDAQSLQQANGEDFNYAAGLSDVMTQLGKGGGAGIIRQFANGPEAQGTISAIEPGGTKLTLNKNKVVNLASDAVLADVNGTITKDSLKVGDRVVAVGKVESDNSLTAKALIRLPALPKVLVGDFVSSDASTLKIKNNNVEWTATLGTNAKITKDGKDAKLTDLTNTQKVTVVGLADETAHTIVATSITQGRPTIAALGDFTNGKIKSIDTAGNSFVVTRIDPATRNSADATVKVDSNTKYLGNTIKGLSDLKVDDTVMVRGTKQTDGSYLATEVVSGNGFMRGIQAGPGGKGQGGQIAPGGQMRPGGRGQMGGSGGNTNSTGPVSNG
ncbi:MAG: hypothetical protein HXX08_03315 [Chloroflexi bacterium]|uniref:DUF5666 domain-containing protein n=1 Tax=Candidatus Chlorohelix allophototropha TaxID=3003348 RepID=A0A8T7M2T5_9CHLR|nr:hypothetical protein [Chloroflexota bacterium]WJW66767.1 DUF5666 domain-containing protein [Chloroflexota bacterium L227-S17]